MTTQTLRTSFVLLAIAAIAFFATPTRAQLEVKTGDEAIRIAIVKGHDVYVRCGAAESYYTFARLKDGDMVRIAGEKYEWSRVMPIGPAFADAFGFIKYPTADAARFRLAADGKSGVTLNKMDIIAPNLDAKGNAKDSWKSLVRLDADQMLRVLETTHTDKDTIHKVALPDSAQGWVSTASLVPATPDQMKQWMEELAAFNRGEAIRTASKPTATNASNATTASTTSTKPANVPPVTITPAASTSTASTTTTNEAAVDVATTTTPIDTEVMTAQANTPTAVAEVKPPEPKLPTLDDLESALKKLQKEPIENAEVTPLRELYLELAKRSDNAKTLRYCKGRAEQLQVWADIQKKRAEVDIARERAKMSADEAIAVERALESSAEYVAVGRVAASTIYDGESLPKLLRLQDASTGRTVAYLHLDEQYEAANLIGNLVGIVGERHYDGGLRLNIVEPKRIDLLMPESRTATVPWDHARPD